MAHIKAANSLGRMELVCGEREVIDTEGFDIELHLARRLHRIGVKRHAFDAADGGDFFNGKDHAGLVVGHHH